MVRASTRLFTATPNDDDPTAAMTTNCGQPPMPNSVVGAATLTTASHGRGARGDRSGRWQADPQARSAEERKRRGSTARSDHLRVDTLVSAAAG